MTETDLVSAIAENTGVNQTDIKDSLDGLKDIVKEKTTSEDPEEVRLSGLGKFEQKHIEAREGVTVGKHKNVDIPEKRYPKFTCFDSAKKEG